MTENVNACPLCGNDQRRLFDRREFRGQVVTNQLCLKCGLVYQSPRMTASESSAFYTQEYRLLYEGSAEPTSRNLTDQRGRAESLRMFSRPFITAVGQHLDIGCSVGVLLKDFHEVYHCRLVGIEPNEVHRAHAQEDGLAVYADLNELEKEEKDRFDLISIVHVLEHLPDPVSYLTRVRENLLAQNGWLLLEVPNLFAHDSFEIAHLVSYSSHTLKQTLEVVRLDQHGRPRSRILPLYISLLARSASGQTFVAQPEKLVTLKRRLGMFRRHVLERLSPRNAWISSSD